MEIMYNEFIKFLKKYRIFFVMWRYLKIRLHNKQNLLKLIKAKKAKEYLLWSIRCSKDTINIVKNNEPFCVATSAELGIELGMDIDDALDFHNRINDIINS